MRHSLNLSYWLSRLGLQTHTDAEPELDYSVGLSQLVSDGTNLTPVLMGPTAIFGGNFPASGGAPARNTAFEIHSRGDGGIVVDEINVINVKDQDVASVLVELGDTSPAFVTPQPAGPVPIYGAVRSVAQFGYLSGPPNGPGPFNSWPQLGATSAHNIPTTNLYTATYRVAPAHGIYVANNRYLRLWSSVSNSYLSCFVRVREFPAMRSV